MTRSEAAAFAASRETSPEIILAIAAIVGDDPQAIQTEWEEGFLFDQVVEKAKALRATDEPLFWGAEGEVA